jgi:hypothetical protein
MPDRRDAADFDTGHARARSIHGRRQKLYDVDMIVEFDARGALMNPTDLARDLLPALQLDGDRRAGFKSAIGAHHHSSGRDILDETELPAFSDSDGAHAKKGQVAFVVTSFDRLRSVVREGVERGLNRFFFHSQLRPNAIFPPESISADALPDG